MEYARLGRSGIEVSRISMGTHHLEVPGDIDRHAGNIVYAYQKGINFFETSVSYGEGNSELILGEAIKEMKKGERPFYITSKSHYGDHDTFRRHLESSLKRMGIDCIDAFTCLWGVKSYFEWSGVRAFGALDEMLKAREEGLIRCIAITTHMKDEDMVRVVRDYPFDFTVMGYNVMNASYRTAGLIASYESGAGNIAMNPLAMGEIVKYPEVFDAIRIREGQSLVQAAYDYMLSSPYIHSVLGGFNEKEHIDEAVCAMERHVPYTPGEYTLVRQKLGERMDRLPMETRVRIGAAIRKRPFILREEAADFFHVYPLSI